MAISKSQILEAVKQMPVMELVELIAEMEKEFNVSAAPIAVAAVGGAGPAAVVEEQTEFTVILASFGENKVNVIKVIRELTGLGLKEAKDLVEGAPAPVKEGVSKKDAEDFKKRLADAGATVEIK